MSTARSGDGATAVRQAAGATRSAALAAASGTVTIVIGGGGGALGPGVGDPGSWPEWLTGTSTAAVTGVLRLATIGFGAWVTVTATIVAGALLLGSARLAARAAAAAPPRLDRVLRLAAGVGVAGSVALASPPATAQSQAPGPVTDPTPPAGDVPKEPPPVMRRLPEGHQERKRPPHPAEPASEQVAPAEAGAAGSMPAVGPAAPPVDAAEPADATGPPASGGETGETGGRSPAPSPPPEAAPGRAGPGTSGMTPPLDGGGDTGSPGAAGPAGDGGLGGDGARYDRRPHAEHLVLPGENLWALAERAVTRHLGRSASDAEVAPYWAAIVEANSDRLVDPDLIFPGDRVLLPPLA